MVGNELFGKLKDELAELYTGVEEIRAVLRDAGIALKSISFQGSASSIWSDVLDEASKRDKLLDLVKVARKDYPNRKLLEEIERELESGGDTKKQERLKAYLAYLIEQNGKLRLPDSSEVELERVYVSLRADAMNATERQAENELYLEDVAEILREGGVGAVEDLYVQFGALRKVIARHPRMRMLQARGWEKLLSVKEQASLNLAEVVQRHQYAVLLGDPGSGKTTLGRWLVLQYARALQEGQSRLEVPLDKVRPTIETELPDEDELDENVSDEDESDKDESVEANKLVDLGPARLPIFIRIGDYAQERWPKGKGDQEIGLVDFIGKQHRKLPRGLSQEALAELAQSYLDEGKALVVLDGLDEVGDPSQRRLVMLEVNKFIQGQARPVTANQWEGNRVLLTSRIVGYQFHPLTHLPHYTVEDMDEAAISAFCGAWMNGVAGLEAGEAAQQATRLKQAIFDHAHPGVRVLAGNPLLLTILAQVYWASAERALPARRVTLFEEASFALYKQREAFWDGVGITHLRLTRAMAAVAHEIQANELTSFAEEGTVKVALSRVLRDPEQVTAVLQAAREVSGFLVARGEGVYGFLHRSLQEYFAAKYLTEKPEEVAHRLSQVALDPTWREPVTLGVGLVSQRSYTDGRRRLPEVFEALLNRDDPAGEFLPRRELLVGVALGDCERVPEGIALEVGQRLLTLYAEREGRGKSPVLRKRIQQAFRGLKEGPGRTETEIALGEALEGPDFEKRYAAVELVLETEWWNEGVARALVAAWKKYPDPAGSLLVALERISQKQPECFKLDFLQFRQVVETRLELWERAQYSVT